VKAIFQKLYGLISKICITINKIGRKKWFMEKIVIYGAGMIGTSEQLVNFLESNYEIVAYCDSDREKYGKVYHNYRVIGFKEMTKLIDEKQIDMVVVAIAQQEIVDSIMHEIETECDCEGTKIIGYRQVLAENKKKFMPKENYNKNYIDFSKNAVIWLDNIMSEVDFWINCVAKEDARGREDYLNRLHNHNFIYEKSLNTDYLVDYLSVRNTPMVYDIGCGLAPRFGELLPNGNRILLTEVDPLAPFYNVINAKFAPCEYSMIKFGMFEYIDMFLQRESADAIIINNALDHCIDPYKSIIKCLSVLKKDGLLHLNHGRMEGVVGGYGGLHQWNLDCDEEDNFIIWNYQTMLNVSKRLKNIAEINVFHSDEKLPLENQSVWVEMIKKNDFNMDEYLDLSDEKKDMAQIIEKLMELMAREDTNNVFGKLLNG